MNRIDKILKICFGIIAISVIFSIATTIYLRVEEPVFITNYCQYNIGDIDGMSEIMDEQIVIKYINNIDSKKEVNGITFKGYENLNYYASEHNNSNFTFYQPSMEVFVDRVGPYGIHNVYITIPSDLNLENWKDILLTEATIAFNDGTSQIVDLGEILLTKIQHDNSDFDFIMGQGSNDVGSVDRYNLLTDIEVVGVKNLFKLDTEELYTVEIDNPYYEDKNETKYKKGEYIKFIGVDKKPVDIIKKYTSYKLDEYMEYKDSEGNINSKRVYTYRSEPYFNFANTVKYLKARGKQ